MASQLDRKSAELCVYGYIRRYCISCQLPDALIQLCTLMFFVNIDTWNISGEFLPCAFYDIGKENRLATRKKLGWSNWKVIFGTFIVTKGEIQTWKLLADATSHRKAVVGVIDLNARGICEGYFPSAQGSYDAFGLSLESKTPVKTGMNTSYFRMVSMERVREADKIEMTLNMTVNDNKKYGTLSFKLNEEDLGIAYDNLDIEKEYCLAVSVGVAGSEVEIVE